MKPVLYCAVIFMLISVHTVHAAPVMSPAEKRIFDDLNQERIKNGLSSLEWNDQVAKAARDHAQSLSKNRKLSHQFAGEPSLLERIGAAGARFTLAAENVALTQYVEDVHLSLMTSSGHRANILSSKYNAVGIGVVEEAGWLYVTQDFIFLIPVYSEEQFGLALAAALNGSRRTKGMLNVRADKLLHDAACSTDGDPNKVSGLGSGVRSVVVFTSSEPHRLPAELLDRATDPAFHRVNFGVCFRPDREHGYANFWVVAAFGR